MCKKSERSVRAVLAITHVRPGKIAGDIIALYGVLCVVQSFYNEHLPTGSLIKKVLCYCYCFFKENI